MSINPIYLIEIPVIFEDLSKDNIDFESLGIKDESNDNREYVPERDIVVNAKFQIDRIAGYFPIITKAGYQLTVVYMDGIRFWIKMKYDDFNKMYMRESVDFNMKLERVYK